MKRNWHKILYSFIGFIFLIALFVLLRPDTYLPHQKLILAAPYDLSHPPISLLPMGERIYHANTPKGHPGIDFQWDSPSADVLSSSDGTISSIRQVFDKWNKWEIDVTSWPYVVRYKEMETYNQNLKVGQKVKVGDFLGHPANPMFHHQIGAYQIHWEFGSPSVIQDRFCPMTYFDPASRASVEAVWDKTNWQYKSQYPSICNGDYANKTG